MYGKRALPRGTEDFSVGEYEQGFSLTERSKLEFRLVWFESW